MKLVDILLLSLSVSFFIIAVHQTFYYPIAGTYWIFMISVGFLFTYLLRKEKQIAQERADEKKLPNQKKRSKK